MNMTPIRLAWLQHLAARRHWVYWDRMPRKQGKTGFMRRRDGKGQSASNKTWVALRDEGLIIVRYFRPHFAEPHGHYFCITTKGLQLLGLDDGCDAWFKVRR